MPVECADLERYDFVEAKEKSKNRKCNSEYPKNGVVSSLGPVWGLSVSSSSAGQEPLKFAHLSPRKTIKALLWETNGVFLEQAQNKAFQHKIDDFHR